MFFRRTRRRSAPTSFRPLLELLEDRLSPAVITVTGTGDTIAVDGLVTLREAITAANTNLISGDAAAGDPGLDTIRFNIAGAGVHTIQPTAALPDITEAVVIDGYSQPGASPNSLAVGNNAVLRIELDGSNLTLSANGLAIISGSTIRGLVINSFLANGIDVFAGAGRNVIEGNFIGTDATGTMARGNGAEGIRLDNSPDNRIGGTTPAARNLISGNAGSGILLTNNARGTLIQGNYLGTTASGAPGLPNLESGVRVSNNSVNNTIGGTVAGAGNLIAFNTVAGVNISFNGTINNPIRGNAIFGNGGLGIDLAPAGADGPTPNDFQDPDGGGASNNLQNFPVLGSAVSTGGTTIIAGSLNSTPNRVFLIDFYASPDADPSGLGEGKNYLGATTVTTDANGNVSFTVSFPVALPFGHVVTATATTTSTDPFGDTSEFSRAIDVTVTGSQRLVSQVYLDLLGRAADFPGLGFWTGLLDRGQLTAAQVVLEIEKSVEYKTLVVKGWYVRLLHREADSPGLTNWVNALLTGATDEQVQAGFLGSPEYLATRGGGTNDGFLNALYQDLLNRLPDDIGRASFTSLLDGGTSRDNVARIILSSLEYRRVLVESFYQRFLHRPADGGGLNSFVTSLGEGQTDEQVIANIVGSLEYQAHNM